MYKNKTTVCVIPARLGSSRFPNKPLAKINGREMVLRVADIAKQSKYFDEIIIATEDKIIQDLATDNNYRSVITRSHYTCTHRVAEVANTVPANFIFNLQGDEPLTDPKWIDSMIMYAIDNDIDVLMMKNEKGWTSDKTSRRDLIKKNFRVIHIFGDQLDDFIPLQKTATNITSRKALIDQYSDMWGEKWYMLINPMYGEWEEALYEHCWSCFPEESDRVIQRLKALD